MNRRIFLLGLPGLAGCTSGRTPRLNVYNWSNYIGPSTIADFERETGIQVRYGIYENGEEVLAKIMTGNSGWDVAFPTNHYLSALRSLKMVAPIRHGRLRNLGNLAERFRNPEWDPGLTHSIPYMWGSTGILFDRSLGVTAWKDLWNPEYAGRVTMLDSQDDVLGACLRTLGYSWNTTSERELAAAKREGMRVKANLRAFLNAEVRDQVVAGDVLMAQLWVTAALPVLEEKANLNFVIPEEGSVFYCDSAILLRESRREDLAHVFLDYLLQPKVAAACVAKEKTGTVLNGVQEFLPKTLATNGLLFPPENEWRRSEWLQTMPPSVQRLRDRFWTEIKSA